MTELSTSIKVYEKLYKESIESPDEFWAKQSQILDWHIRPNKIRDIPSPPSIIGTKWFTDGKLNASYNCIDRHAQKTPEKIAIIWEGDDGNSEQVTYRELLENVQRYSNMLKKLGASKGDVVCIYLPMVLPAAYAILACCRIGCIHNVVFAGFSADALRQRLQDCKCKFLLTADYGLRDQKFIPLKKFVDEALAGNSTNVQKVAVLLRSFDGVPAVPMTPNRDFSIEKLLLNIDNQCEPEIMDSEDPLFILYTSGSTGKPKGIVHTTGGYLLYAAVTTKFVFGVEQNDIFGCMADIGWITGHSYVIYGPLLNGITTFMFESTPLYPDPGRYWRMVETHRITQFYTSPTAIRSLQKFKNEFVSKYDRTSLKTLGSVGEPINPEAWQWYFDVVGNKKIQVCDTYWQTETGGIIISALAGKTRSKKGSASFPFFGVQPILLDPLRGRECKDGEKGVLCIKSAWPGIARTIYGNDEMYHQIYFEKYPGLYFTGDGGFRDCEGYFCITGRVDDVLSISGHRIGTAEIEKAITLHENVVECAVVGVFDELRGQKWLAFIICKNEEVSVSEKMIKENVRKYVGAFASFGEIRIVPGLPKTRSGKIMRRILRKIVNGESGIGDVSTLSNPDIVQKIVDSMIE